MLALQVADLADEVAPLGLVRLGQLLLDGVDHRLGLVAGVLQQARPLPSRLGHQLVAVGHRLGCHLGRLIPGVGQEGVGLELGFGPQPFRLLLRLPDRGVGLALGGDEGVAQGLVEVGLRGRGHARCGLSLRRAPGLHQPRLGGGRPALRLREPRLQALYLIRQRGQIGKDPVHLVLAVPSGLLLEPDIRYAAEEPQFVALQWHCNRVTQRGPGAHWFDVLRQAMIVGIICPARPTPVGRLVAVIGQPPTTGRQASVRPRSAQAADDDGQDLEADQHQQLGDAEAGQAAR